MVGLPLTFGPIAFFLATDHGTNFAGHAAAGMLAGTISRPPYSPLPLPSPSLGLVSFALAALAALITQAGTMFASVKDAQALVPGYRPLQGPVGLLKTPHGELRQGPSRYVLRAYRLDPDG